MKVVSFTSTLHADETRHDSFLIHKKYGRRLLHEVVTMYADKLMPYKP